MTPSQQAKAAGLKSLAVVQEMTGQSAQTLSNWAKNKPDLLRVVLAGCRALQEDPAYAQQPEVGPAHAALPVQLLRPLAPDDPEAPE